MLRLALVLLMGRSRVLRVVLWTALGLVAGACIFHSVRGEAGGANGVARAIQTPGTAHPRDGAGRIRLEVRNEALVTEYVNRLELLEVRHAADETALPDPDGAALAVRDLVPATAIADAMGRDLHLLLARPDGAAFRTDAQ